MLEVDPLQLLCFDEKIIFNSDNQQGGNVANVINYDFSERERQQYEKQITHLEEEVLFLRKQLEVLSVK